MTRLVALGGMCLLLCAAAPRGHGQPRRTDAAPEVPPHNRADQKQAPPRPAATSAEQAAEQLFGAIVRDDVEAAAPLFFPRAAFLLVKDIVDPGRYYDQLYKRFGTDIHALHARLPGLADARFERFELSNRGGFVRVHEEGNKLPYWAARHNTLYYRSGTTQHQFELRVMITWDDRWYVIHLDMFHTIDR
ncbi:MAG: hypothetical protein ABW321_33295 [Polyangiales bacterium]